MFEAKPSRQPLARLRTSKEIAEQEGLAIRGDSVPIFLVLTYLGDLPTGQYEPTGTSALRAPVAR